ncbi:MAG: hypothetical protein HOP03_16455 [Lysobacter sp.]|nr:hypothetical protein [Lysobacter sp.]
MKKMVVIAFVFLGMILGLQMLRSKMSKIDEALVYEYYQDNINATRRFDARKLCAMYDLKYRMVDVSRGPRGEERIEMGRQEACKAVDESMTMMKKLVEKTRVEPEFKYTIESVSISPDRRQATVKLRASMRIGKKLSITSSGTETLVRRLGDMRSLTSETRSKVSMR